VILYFFCGVIPPRGTSNTASCLGLPPHKVEPELRNGDNGVASQDCVVGSPTSVKYLSNSTSDIVAKRKLY
jgi:hypothetical protein